MGVTVKLDEDLHVSSGVSRRLHCGVNQLVQDADLPSVSSGVSRRLHCGRVGGAGMPGYWPCVLRCKPEAPLRVEDGLQVDGESHVSSGVSRRLHCGPQTVGEGVGAGTVSSGVSRRLHCGSCVMCAGDCPRPCVLRCKPEAPLRVSACAKVWVVADGCPPV